MGQLSYFPIDFDQTYIKMLRLKGSILLDILTFFLSIIISSETTRPIEVKFLIEPLWHGGMKVCSNGPGHMTEMAAMPIYGKTL